MRVLKSFLPLFALAAPALALPARAATLCVNSSGGYPCYTNISDAVEDAVDGDIIRVGAGTYTEMVVVNKAISLVTENAIIDATGQSRGFFVNGMGTESRLNGVNIAGFTVRNAKYEGILVVNATAVTLSNNTVENNNRALDQNTCPGLNDFESNGSADCGQGIHLMGADHAVVTNNTVQGNAGGILLSDDTGPTHDNLLSFNSVIQNPLASGITLASNSVALMVQVVRPLVLSKGVSDAATGSGPASSYGSYGVYHNTLYGNRVRSNGLANKNGAGVALFASQNGTSTYGNIIVANYLSENALPGVALHAEGTGQAMTDNLIVGNTVVNNGMDTAMAVTPGPTGVSLYAIGPQSGNMVIGNAVQGATVDVAVNNPAQVQVQFNALGGNGNGVANLGAGPVIATQNFWSCPNGPTIPGSCSLAFGSNVQASPWLALPLPAQPNF